MHEIARQLLVETHQEQAQQNEITHDQSRVLTEEIETCCCSTMLCASTFRASSIAALAKSGKAIQRLKKYVVQDSSVHGLNYLLLGADAN